jgi:hypothetical protein
MFMKILFGASVILSGLFLALPELMAPVAAYGSDPFTVGRIVGILAVVFETWWVIRRLQGIPGSR